MVKLGSLKVFSGLLLGLWLWSGGSRLAMAETLYFWTFKLGQQNTGEPAPGVASGDNYIEAITKDHGTRRGSRIAEPWALAFDFYQVFGNWGSGFAAEIQRYSLQYRFNDGSRVNLETQAFTYGLTLTYRGGWFFPFVGIGTGNYDVKIHEKLVNSAETTNAAFRDSAPAVFYYELGSRFPLGDWGFTASWRATAAKLKIDTTGDRLELGGQAFWVGLYYGY